MEYMGLTEIQFLGIAVAAVVVAATAAYFFSSKKSKGCINPDTFEQFKLVERTQLSHNVAKFKFALPSPFSVLGLPIGQHISCRGKDSQGEEVIKPYTPTTLDSNVGYFELVIKMYPQGRMSHHFREMHVGDYLAVKGPKGRFKYQPGQVRAFGMLAGGSGITPMFQVARAILENPNDTTKHNISTSTGMNDPAVATWIFELIYETTKETPAEPDSLDNDLVNAWATNLGDDGLWGNNAPAMNRLRNFQDCN